MATALNAVQIHSLAVAAKPAADVRDILDVGKHQVSFRCRVKGTLMVSDSQSLVTKTQPKADFLVAAMFSLMTPEQREQLAATLVAEHHALRAGVEDECKQLAARTLKAMAISQSVDRRGAVTGQLSATVLA